MVLSGDIILVCLIFMTVWEPLTVQSTIFTVQIKITTIIYSTTLNGLRGTYIQKCTRVHISDVMWEPC